MVFGAEREVRDEVAVHDVEVDPVGARLLRRVGPRRRGSTRSASRMLAATLARPVAIATPPSRPAPARRLRSPRSASALATIEPLAASGDGRRRRLARALGRQLAARGPDLLAAVAPDGRADPGVPQRRGEALDDRHRARGPGRVGDRVHRDEIDMRVVAAQQVGHRLGVEVGVVHPADHRDLVADPPAGGLGVVARGRHDLGDRPAPVQRDEDVAERVARRVRARPPA